MADPNKRITLQQIKQHPWFTMKLPKELQVCSLLLDHRHKLRPHVIALSKLALLLPIDMLQCRHCCSARSAAQTDVAVPRLQGDNFRFMPGTVVTHLQTEDEVRAVVAEAKTMPA